MAVTERRFAVGLMLAGVAAGCGPPHAGIPTGPVRAIVIGQTTRAELTEAFGAPAEARDAMLVWREAREPWFGAAHTRQLTVVLDSAGRVARYAFESDFPEDLAAGGGED